MPIPLIRSLRRGPSAQPGLLRTIALGARMAVRDARAGELRLLILALTIAVAAMTSVGFLADRVGRALERNALQMLGADVKIEGDAPPPDIFLQQARDLDLTTSTITEFPSMASTGQTQQLVSVKAVQPGYPLRGTLRIADGLDRADRDTHAVPPRGQVWVDGQLLVALQRRVGDTLDLGDLHLRISQVLTVEPDRGLQFVNAAPRALINAGDLPQSGLVGPASRIRYSLLAAGQAGQVQRFTAWAATRLARGQRLDTLEDNRPEVRRVLDRAQRFLALVALLAVLISAVAVALAARRFMLRHRDGIAVMRCLGAAQSHVTRLLAVEFLLIGLVSCTAGCAVGLGVHYGLIAALDKLVGQTLAPPSALPAAQGFVVGLWLLFGFALPSLDQLRRAPPARVLRHDRQDGLSGRGLWGYSVGAVGFAALIWWFAGDLKLGAVVAGGFLAAFAFFAMTAIGLIAILNRVRQAANGRPALRFALAGIVRRKAATVAQVCALGLGLMALLLLAMTRTDLVQGWKRTLPADAPNRFVINIQPDQREGVRRHLIDAGVGKLSLAPAVRGRLIAIDKRPVGPKDYEQARAKRLVDREFNLSYMDHLPDYNRIEQGRDLNPAAREVSMETGIAQTLGLKVGQTLTFDVAGQPIDVVVTSLRSVDWDSMRVNFFAILTPPALADAPQNWITSFYLPAAKEPVISALVRDFPNLTVIDVDALLKQLQSVLDRVVDAVQLLFLFTLAAGVLVLAAALTATRDERIYEAAILRALGATRRQLASAQRVELLGVGAMAGLLAAIGAQAIAWALSRYVFDFDAQISAWPWAAAIAAGALGAWAGGALTLRGVLRSPPLATLRDA